MALTVLLVLQPANQPCLCMCSLGPGAEDLGEIKAITSAGYVDTERNELGSLIFEFGMTQAFWGQKDGTSRSEMGIKPPNRGLLGFGDPLQKKLRPNSHLAYQLNAR